MHRLQPCRSSLMAPTNQSLFSTKDRRELASGVVQGRSREEVDPSAMIWLQLETGLRSLIFFLRQGGDEKRPAAASPNLRVFKAFKWRPLGP